MSRIKNAIIPPRAYATVAPVPDSELLGATASHEKESSRAIPVEASPAAESGLDRKRILVLYTDSGYGHIATARVLRDYLGAERPWRIDVVDVYIAKSSPDSTRSARSLVCRAPTSTTNTRCDAAIPACCGR
ncbi:MAG: hypothetical protein ACREEL_02060 [Stellaceae bacterium]